MCAATMTRGAGFLLVVPLLWEVWQEQKAGGQPWYRWLFAVLPLVVFGVWRVSPWGQAFAVVQPGFFARETFAVGRSLRAWQEAFVSIGGANGARAAYSLGEFAALGMILVSIAGTWRRYRAVALFSALMLVLFFFSGVAQGMLRLAATVPSVFLFLAGCGKEPLFDRLWTLVSGVLLGLTVLLFTLRYWVG